MSVLLAVTDGVGGAPDIVGRIGDRGDREKRQEPFPPLPGDEKDKRDRKREEHQQRKPSPPPDDGEEHRIDIHVLGTAQRSCAKSGGRGRPRPEPAGSLPGLVLPTRQLLHPLPERPLIH